MDKQINYYCVTNKSGSHGFRKNEVVKIIKAVSSDTLLAENDKGEMWAVNVKQLIPYAPIGEGKVAPNRKYNPFMIKRY